MIARDMTATATPFKGVAVMADVMAVAGEVSRNLPPRVIHSEGVHLVSASTGGRWTVSSGTLYRRLTLAGRSPTNTRASGWATAGDPTTRPGPVPC